MVYLQGEKNKRKLKLLIIFIGLVICITSLFIILYFDFFNYQETKINEDKISDFFEQETREDSIGADVSSSIAQKPANNYIGILEIPKIKLRRGIVNKDSIENNVNKNIYVLKETIFPDEKSTSHIILASHSGNSYISYFKNLNKLMLSDNIYFYYKGFKYSYMVIDRYEVEKTGTVQLNKNSYSDMTLISCIYGTNKQVVYVAKLDNKEKY